MSAEGLEVDACAVRGLGAAATLGGELDKSFCSLLIVRPLRMLSTISFASVGEQKESGTEDTEDPGDKEEEEACRRKETVSTSNWS